MVEIEKIQGFSRNPNKLVKLTEMGNISEVMYMEKQNNRSRTQKISKDQYMVIDTGEIREYTHGFTRADNKNGLRKTFARCRALINTNVTDVSKVRWITLTYRENMTDPERLYTDFKKFNQRFQRYVARKGHSKPEYIVMMEPQARGAWHAHLLYIWTAQKAPYIPNSDLAVLWQQGFTKCKKLDNVDNVGAYLTAYLGDMELSEINKETDSLSLISGSKGMKTVEVADENGKKFSKSIIKGARLNLYPAGFNMIRHSTGIKEPDVNWITQEMAREKVSGATKTFSAGYKITDSESGYENVVLKDYYNSARQIKN